MLSRGSKAARFCEPRLNNLEAVCARNFSGKEGLFPPHFFPQLPLTFLILDATLSLTFFIFP